jgi:methylenetetrahydrofolate reductase (NADPH)
MSTLPTHIPSCHDAGAQLDGLSSQAQYLLQNSSIELSTNGETAIRKAAEFLPPGTTVFVPKMPKQTLDDKLVQIRLLTEVGLNPVPHIVAKQLRSEHDLRRFVASAVADGGVSEVLVIGGDGDRSIGPFKDAAAVIASGILREAGIRKLSVGGYPDGHPVISASALQADLEAKAALAEEQEHELSIVTQFSFAPDSIADYCSHVACMAPGIAVYAGLAGPTSPAQLLRFATICGVSMSLKGANKLGFSALKLASNSGPDKQLKVLAERKATSTAGNLAGIHLFSFGGFVDSAKWLSEKL